MSQSWARSIKCSHCGDSHFGAGGAAGILLVRRDNSLPGRPATHVVLQHRADTRSWSIPGGVRDYPETYRQTALREAAEEISLPRNCTQGANPLVVIRREEALLDHGDWKYTTFIADVRGAFTPRRPPGDTESISVAWAPIDQVGVPGGRFFPLLPSFWSVWDQLRDMVREMDEPVQVNVPAQTSQTVQPIQPFQTPPIQPIQPIQAQPIQPIQPVQPTQSVQDVNPIRPDEPVSPRPVSHDPATAPSNTWIPIDPGVHIVESDEEQEESVEPQGAGQDKQAVPIDHPVPPLTTPAAGKHGDAGAQIVESDKQHQLVEPEGAGQDKKGVPSDHLVPPQTIPAAGESGHEEDAFASSPRAGREFRGGRIGYMSWNAGPGPEWNTKPDTACRPS